MGTFVMQDVYSITGIGLVIVGKVEGDIIKVGMRARAEGKMIEVKTIEMHHEHIAVAHPGDAVGMAVKVSTSDAMNRNDSFWAKLFSNNEKADLKFLKSHAGKRLQFS